MNISMGKRSGIFDEKSMEVLVSTLFLIYVVKIPMEPLVILPWQYIKPIINLLDFYAIYLLFQPVRGYRIGTQIPTPGTVYRLDRIITWTALYSVKTKNMKIHDFRSIYQQNMKVGKFTVFTPFRNLRYWHIAKKMPVFVRLFWIQFSNYHTIWARRNRKIHKNH